MSNICEICGKHPSAGRSYARRGLAKKKGGVGRKITGVTKRRFVPNIQTVRVKDGNGTVRRARICAKCLRTGVRKGTITKATRKPRPPKKAPEPVFEPASSSLEREPSGEAEGAAPSGGPARGGERGVSDRLAEEIDTVYEEEKATEREAEMLAEDEPPAPPSPPLPPLPPEEPSEGQSE